MKRDEAIGSTLGVALALLAGAPAAADPEASVSWLQVAGERMTYDEAEALLRAPLAIASASHRAKSSDASTIKLQMEGGWEAKLRIVEDLGDSNRNEDPKLDVASYVVSRWLFPEGAIVYPSVVREVEVAKVLPLVDAEGQERLRAWSRDGVIEAVVSLVGEGATRAGESDWFGARLVPEVRAAAEELPSRFLRQVGDMNVLAILVRNSDVYGKNWEIRDEDGACFIVDHGTAFPYRNWVSAYHKWREPCAPMAAAVAASTVNRVRELVADPAELDLALARFEGTDQGLPADFRVIPVEQARSFLECIDQAGPEEVVYLAAKQLRTLLAVGRLHPYRDGPGEGQPLVVVTDW